MQTHADPSQEHKGQFSNAEKIAQGNSSLVGEFAGSSVTQAEPKESTNPASNNPHIAQAKSIQAMANNSPQVKRAGSLQSMANSFSLRSMPNQPHLKSVMQKQPLQLPASNPFFIGKNVAPVQRSVSVREVKYFRERQIASAGGNVDAAWQAFKQAVGNEEALRKLEDSDDHPIDQFVPQTGSSGGSQEGGQQQQQNSNRASFGTQDNSATFQRPIGDAGLVSFEWHQHRGEPNPHLKLISVYNGTESHIMPPFDGETPLVQIDQAKILEISNKMIIQGDPLRNLIQRAIQEIQTYQPDKVKHV